MWYGSSLEGGVGPKENIFSIMLHINYLSIFGADFRYHLEKAALASFVEENGIGICVSSLLDLDAIITQMTKESYNALRMNVAKVNERISQGYYCKEAIQKAYTKLSPEIK